MSKTAFNWQDPFSFQALLTDEERMIQQAAYDYCQDRLMSRVLLRDREHPYRMPLWPLPALLAVLGEDGGGVALGVEGDKDEDRAIAHVGREAGLHREQVGDRQWTGVAAGGEEEVERDGAAAER